MPKSIWKTVKFKEFRVFFKTDKTVKFRANRLFFLDLVRISEKNLIIYTISPIKEKNEKKCHKKTFVK